MVEQFKESSGQPRVALPESLPRRADCRFRKRQQRLGFRPDGWGSGGRGFESHRPDHWAIRRSVFGADRPRGRLFLFGSKVKQTPLIRRSILGRGDLLNAIWPITLRHIGPPPMSLL